MKRLRLIQWTAAFIFFVLSTTRPLFSSENKIADFFPEASKQSVYIFSEHLHDANAEIFLSNKENRKGIWEQDQFRFYGMETDAQIQTVSQSSIDGDTSWEAIEMRSLPRSYRKLQFMSVPPAQRINLYYRSELPAEFVEKNPKQNLYFYFNIYAGKKLIRQVRVSSQEKGWIQVTIPMGILGILNRNYPLTFTLSGNDASPINFQFFAEAL